VSSTSTAIEWTDATWNPVTGCSKVSEGCRNCYAAALAPRLAAMGKEGYTDLPWTKPNAPQNVFTHPARLDAPLRWSKPRRIFVNSMSDLFHELVPFDFVDRVFAVMALAPRHTFQVLTKRPERMAEYFDPENPPERELAIVDAARALAADKGAPRLGEGVAERLQDRGLILPLPNAWLGTSVEDGRVLGRVDHLRRSPAVVRFLSCEPLIGPLDGLDLEGVHWVIVGGESGPNHRPIEAEWVRGIRENTVEAGAAFFFKQWGGLKPKAGGRKLDGQTYDEMPAIDGDLTHAAAGPLPTAL
jgi:protein gp37